MGTLGDEGTLMRVFKKEGLRGRSIEVELLTIPNRLGTFKNL